jgi:hypothetical protein
LARERSWDRLDVPLAVREIPDEQLAGKLA